MNATVNAKDLDAVVGWAMSAVPHRSPLPILSAISLAVADGELAAEGFDFETHARSSGPADGHLDPVHVNGAMLAKVASQVTGVVTFTIDGTWLHIASGKDRYRLPTMPADDYPTLPGLPPAVGDSVAFIDAVSCVAQSAAAATGPAAAARPQLAGVHIEAADGHLTLRATDGYRMSRVETAWDGQDFAVLVPAKILGERARAIGIGQVGLHATPNRFGLTAGHSAVSTVLLDLTTYPAMSSFAMIDTTRERALNADGGVFIGRREELAAAMKRAAWQRSSNRPLHFHFTEDGDCTVGAAGESDAEADIALTGDYLGPDRDVYAQDAYFASVVDATPSPYVAIGTIANGKPMHVVGCPDDSGAPDETVQHIVMSVRVTRA